MSTHYIEIQNHCDSEIDEANGRVSTLYPVLALLRETKTGLVVDILHCTCPSIARRAWGVSDVRDLRAVGEEV